MSQAIAAGARRCGADGQNGGLRSANPPYSALRDLALQQPLHRVLSCHLRRQHATDLPLTKQQAHRCAVVAHDGMARAIHPVHTPLDGDTVFVTSTGGAAQELELVDLLRLEVAATQVLAQAIRTAVT